MDVVLCAIMRMKHVKTAKLQVYYVFLDCICTTTVLLHSIVRLNDEVYLQYTLQSFLGLNLIAKLKLKSVPKRFTSQFNSRINQVVLTFNIQMWGGILHL